jgi:hypothetical protein
MDAKDKENVVGGQANEGNVIVEQKVVKKRIKNKEKCYMKERQEVLDKLIAIVGIHFYSHEIDEKKQKQILELDEDIKKYFSVSNWSCYKPKLELHKRPLSMVRSLLHDMNIEYTSRPDVLRNNNNVKQITTTEYNVKYVKKE